MNPAKSDFGALRLLNLFREEWEQEGWAFMGLCAFDPGLGLRLGFRRWGWGAPCCPFKRLDDIFDLEIIKYAVKIGWKLGKVAKERVTLKELGWSTHDLWEAKAMR